MNNKILMLLLNVLFYSCREQNAHIKIPANEKMLSNPQDEPSQVATTPMISYTNNQLQGVWGGGSNDNANFVIKKDSMYYVEDLAESYLYTISNDSLIFHVDREGIRFKILSLDGDTLKLDNSGIKETYIRRN